MTGVKSYARSEVIKLYGGSSSSIQICPGEDSCELWLGTGGKNHKLKEKKVCHPCPMFQTKTITGKKNHTYFNRLVNRSFHLRRLQKAGYPPEEWKISTPEFQTMILLEEYIEASEIALKRETADLMMAIIKSRG